MLKPTGADAFASRTIQSDRVVLGRPRASGTSVSASRPAATILYRVSVAKDEGEKGAQIAPAFESHIATSPCQMIGFRLYAATDSENGVFIRCEERAWDVFVPVSPPVLMTAP